MTQCITYCIETCTKITKLSNLIVPGKKNGLKQTQWHTCTYAGLTRQTFGHGSLKNSFLCSLLHIYTLDIQIYTVESITCTIFQTPE